MNNGISQLRDALQCRTGFNLETVLGCKKLDEWLKSRGVYISYSTLTRIFKLAKLQTLPRQRTLDELVSVLGFADFKTFLLNDRKDGHSNSYSIDLQFAFEKAIVENRQLEASQLYLELVRNSESAKIFAKDLARLLFQTNSHSAKTLKYLAESESGRKDFYLTYIDEDDCSGIYAQSLISYLSLHANESERQFVELYLTRKEYLKGNETVLSAFHSSHLQSFSNVHLKSRAMEVFILKAMRQSGSAQRLEMSKLMEMVFQLFCECKSTQEELAVLGRMSRAILYTDALEYIFEHKELQRAMVAVLAHSLIDYEFQIPIYSLLNKIRTSLSIQLPQASSWPNAYFSTVHFMLTKEERLKNSQFFRKSVNIHPKFLAFQ